MNTTIKNSLAVVVGILVGSALNMGIIMISGSVIPTPNGADVTNMEGLKATMHLFEPKHFIMPFLAHALGTFVGAFIASKMASTHKMKIATGIGCWYLLGGIINIMMLPSPIWFTLLDLMLAYIPMAYIAGKLTAQKN